MLRNSYEFEELCEHYPVRIAHRGASGETPENTLLSIRTAIEKYQVDLTEADVHLSRDGVPVLIHDETVDRTTNGKGRVGDYPLSELKRLDSGYHFDPGGGLEFPYRGKGVAIPTLEEVLREFPEARFCLEIKEKETEVVERVVQVVSRVARRVPLVVGSFHGKITREFRRFPSPWIKLAFSRRDVVLGYLAFRLGLRRFSPPARYASLPRSSRGIRLDEESWITFLHQRGVRVFYWTVNDPGEMRTLLERGADGILSDFPDRLNQAFGIGPRGA